jgi:hypothetical protein
MTLLRCLGASLLVVLALAANPVLAASADEQAAMAATQAGCDAIRLHDGAALERLLVPEPAPAPAGS